LNHNKITQINKLFEGFELWLWRMGWRKSVGTIVRKIKTHYKESWGKENEGKLLRLVTFWVGSAF